MSRKMCLATLLAFAIVAYGVELYTASSIGPQLRPHATSVSIKGSDAQAFSGASLDRRLGTIILNPNRPKRTAGATWVFSEYATRVLREQVDGGPPELVINAVERDRGARPATVIVRGCLTAQVHASPHDRILVPLRACPMDRTLVYSVSMRVRNASWVIRSVALQSSESHIRAAQQIERAQRFGSEAAIATDAVPQGTSLNVAGSATWDLLGYEFAHLGASSERCSVDAYVIGPRLYARAKNAWAQVLFDGKPVTRFAIDAKVPEPFVPRASNHYYPAAPFAPVFFSPLYRPAGIVVPVRDPTACRSASWHVGVRVEHASWVVESAGAILSYEPPKALIAGSFALTIALALVLAGILAGAILGAFIRIRSRYGWAALAMAIVIAILALLTHDQWDFPIWVRFINLTAFGHGNPALMWSGTPLWPYLTALFTPIPLTVNALTHEPSDEITALFLKLAAAAAYLWTAYTVSHMAPARYRALLFWMTLLSPLGLYELAGGYREIFAAFFTVLAFSAALRERYLIATLLFTAAASITESLIPLLAASAIFVVAGRRNDTQRPAMYACALFAVGVAGIVVQWAVLPHAHAVQSLVFRAHSYRYGEGSWLGLLTAYRVVPAWVGDLWSSRIALVTFAAITCVFAVRLAKELRQPADARNAKKALACVTGLVAAFFLSYRGIDISTWYALLAVIMLVFYVIDPLSPYPLLLSSIAAACQYAVAGTRDFVNWTYLWPVDKSLFGILGQPVHVFAAVTIALVVAGAGSLALARTSALFGRATPYFGGIFLFAGFATTIRTYPLDVVFCLAVAVLLSVNLFRLWRMRAKVESWETIPAFTVFSAVVLAAAIFAFGSGDLYWSLIGATLILVTLTYGAGFCDLPLGLGALWLMKTQTGYGWLSFAAYAALLVFCGALILKIAHESPLWRQRVGERG